MGEQIIQQPDGLLAVYSTVTDSFIALDATPEELIEWRAERAAVEARETTARQIAQVLDPANKRPYGQFTLAWEKALANDQWDKGSE